MNAAELIEKLRGVPPQADQVIPLRLGEVTFDGLVRRTVLYEVATLTTT